MAPDSDKGLVGLLGQYLLAAGVVGECGKEGLVAVFVDNCGSLWVEEEELFVLLRAHQ